jgi:hypothetical protein
METNANNSEKGKPSKTRNVPVADINFGNVITTVSEKWAASSWLTLKWLTVAQFQADATNYNDTLSSRLSKGTTRPQITQTLETLEKTMDTHLSYVKGYITDKYKKESDTSYFAAFGIEYKNNRYLLPADKNKRSEALKLMVRALTTHGFEDKEFGLAFWTSLKEQYALLVKQASETDGQVSVKVGDKNILKKNLNKGLNAIIYTLKANYPDTYKQELRDWGFQKEKY